MMWRSRSTRRRIRLLLQTLVDVCVFGGLVNAASGTVGFREKVAPILSKHCLKCHGGALRHANLDLRTKAGMLTGGTHGPAVIPGKASVSRLYRMVSGEDAPRMPLDGVLSDSERTLLREWIDQGAEWEGKELLGEAPVSLAEARESETISEHARSFWAFRKPSRPAVPGLEGTAILSHPVDAFLIAARQGLGISSAPRASRTTLVRRAYLDLLGLPPSPEEVSQFVGDTSSNAWEALIDRLLASPHYGERWGRHWLDIARYADSSGFEHDRDRPNAWRYRDYVVNSFNQDKPYNRFLEEQLAGDELDDANEETRTATGFLRAGPRVEFREKDNPQYRYDYLDDMIATTSQALLGLTVQCARCHDHKFDPILQKDYYRLQAIFFPFVDVDYYLAPDDEVRRYLAARRQIETQMQSLREEIARIEAPYREEVFKAEVLGRFPVDVQLAVQTSEEKRTPGQKLLAEQVIRAVGVPAEALQKALKPEDQIRIGKIKEAINNLQKQLPPEPPSAMGITDGDYRFAPEGFGDEPAPGKGVRKENIVGSFLHEGPGQYVPPPCYFLVRGDINNRGTEMQPGFISVITRGNPPTAIAPGNGKTSGRRRALANWIASEDNPLTARVMVNRIWHYHFGRGIVASPNNFGFVGERPSHPDLLDWLASEFISQRWSVKAIHRLLMTSQAYQMKSDFQNEAAVRLDPENRFLWRFPVQRMEAETLRDSILSVSGNLDLTRGGPPVFPKVDSAVLKSMKSGIWKEDKVEKQSSRRSVYVYRKRGMPFPFFEIFDLPDQNVSCGLRYTSTVPTQALTLLNSAFVSMQARSLAEQIHIQTGDDTRLQIRLLYQRALGREPSAKEEELNLTFLKEQEKLRSGDPLAPLTTLTHVVFNLNEFIYVR